MTGIAFITNLLNTLPGTAVYHLLIFLGLLPAAGIAWIEWRQTRNDDLQPFVYALGGIMGLRILGAALAPSQIEATSVAALFTAPFLYAIEPLSILLLLWAFGKPLWLEKDRIACPRCQYDLRSHDVPACPECGYELSADLRKAYAQLRLTQGRCPSGTASLPCWESWGASSSGPGVRSWAVVWPRSLSSFWPSALSWGFSGRCPAF